MNVLLPNYIVAPFRERLDEVARAVSVLLPEEPQEAFVSIGSGESESQFLGIWLFTDKLIVEIRNPLYADRIQYEIATLKDSVDWIRLTADHYDFENEREESQLDLEFTTKDGLSSMISAISRGCPQLLQLYRNRFVTNFIGALEC